MDKKLINTNYKESSLAYSDGVIEDQNSSLAPVFNNLIWGIDEVCKFTAYKKGTIYNLVSNGDIPYRKRGKRLFFVPIEILNWLKGDFQ
jgi:predicted DNA-binding transcriptional regulator AlpA